MLFRSQGMMGSLLIVEKDDFASKLPVGEECPPDDIVPVPVAHTVTIVNAASFPAASNLPVHMGETVRFLNNDDEIHSVLWDTAGSPVGSPIISTGGGFWDVVMSSMGIFNYHCGVHGPSMAGSISVVM